MLFETVNLVNLQGCASDFSVERLRPRRRSTLKSELAVARAIH